MTSFHRLNSVLVVGAMAAASQTGQARAEPAQPATWTLECARPAPGRFVPDDTATRQRVLPSTPRFREGLMTATAPRWRPGLPARRLTADQCDRMFRPGAAMPVLTAEVVLPERPRAQAPVPELPHVVAVPAALAPAWSEGARYTAGQVVLYRNRWFRCLQPHQAWPGAGWSPDAAGVLNVLWKEI